MDITDRELRLLNFYRASELHGGLLLGQLVQRVRDPRLILELTRHSGEEVVHAQLWTETILEVGGRPSPVRETYQTHYARAVGAPASLLHVLALTQVFERRVYRHFTEHLHRAGTHPAVRATLRRMLDEEKGHLSWVKHWLDGQARTRPLEVERVMRRYAEIDAVIYGELVREFAWKEAA